MFNLITEVILLIALLGLLCATIKFYRETQRKQKQIEQQNRKINDLQVFEPEYFNLLNQYESIIKYRFHAGVSMVAIDDMKELIKVYLKKDYLVDENNIEMLIDPVLAFYLSNYPNNFGNIDIYPADCLNDVIKPTIEYIKTDNSLLLLPKQSRALEINWSELNEDFLLE